MGLLARVTRPWEGAAAVDDILEDDETSIVDGGGVSGSNDMTGGKVASSEPDSGVIGATEPCESRPPVGPFDTESMVAIIVVVVVAAAPPATADPSIRLIASLLLFR